jgi:hypothetical protein
MPGAIIASADEFTGQAVVISGQKATINLWLFPVMAGRK